MNATIQVSPLNNSHCKDIVDIIIPIQQIEFKVPVTLADQPDLLDIEATYHQSGGNFWGAFHNGELVGTIAIIATGNNYGALRKMFVRKEYRGKELGIAQLLLDTLIAYCKQNNINAIHLGTIDLLKAAHRFYEKNGFTQLAKADLPKSFPLMGADNIFYELYLSN